jgi:hypothetical protein
MQEEWLAQHREFMGGESDHRPTELRRRALVAIDAGGVNGATMADVHRALKSAHLPAKLVNLVVDRLIEDGHVHRKKILTAGRPRVQMWSFRHAPEEVRDAMAERGLRTDFSRPFWAGKRQEQIIRDVLWRLRGIEMKVRDIEVAAWQIYVDADRAMDDEIFKRPGGGLLGYGELKKLLARMALYRQIQTNEKGDAFSL